MDLRLVSVKVSDGLCKCLDEEVEEKTMARWIQALVSAKVSDVLRKRLDGDVLEKTIFRWIQASPKTKSQVNF